MSLTTISVTRRVTTTMLFIGIVLLGVISISQLSVNFLPSIQVPELLIETELKDASANEIEKVVTKPIESVVSTVNGIKRVTSISRDGRSLITLELLWGTNVDYTMIEVREKLDEVRGNITENASRPTIYKIDPSNESIITIAISQTTNNIRNHLDDDSSVVNQENSNLESKESLMQIRDFSESVIKKRLEQLDGVSQAIVAGGAEREIVIDVDIPKLQSFGLSFNNIEEALKNANVNLEGGTIRKGIFRYSLRTVGEFSNLNEISSVPVGSGTKIFSLKDFATVKEIFAEGEGLIRVNGKESIVIYIKKETKANTINVSAETRKAIMELQNTYPQVNSTIIFDQAEFIRKSISDIQQAIIFGALLALLILFIFLRNPLYPLIVGIVTPISIFLTAILMYCAGISFNIISLTGLALGIGMLGDNAIIIVENYTRLRQQGSSVIEAVSDGAKEINLSVSASTFTNVAIFLPVIFVKGIAQKLFLDMGLTMTFSILASLFVAVTLVPSMLSRLKTKETFLEVEIKTGNERKNKLNSVTKQIISLITRNYDKLKAIYFRTLKYSINNSKPVLIGTIILTLISAGVAFFIKSEAAPDIDQSRFVVEVNLPPSSTLQATNTVSMKLESILLAMPEIQAVVVDEGISSREDYFKILDASIYKATIDCRVKPGFTVSNVVKDIRKKLFEISTFLDSYSAGVQITRPATTFEKILHPQKNDVDIEIIGNDLDISNQIADSVVTRIKTISYLTDINLESGFSSSVNQVWLILKDKEIASYGLTASRVIQELSYFFHEKTATYFNEFDKKIAINIKPMVNNQNYIISALDYGITMNDSPGSPSIPLRNLVYIVDRKGITSIRHDNQQRNVVVHANIGTSGLFQSVNTIKGQLSDLKLPQGYQIKVGGKVDELKEMFKSLLIIILLSIFIVYIILASEYESVIYPLIILTTSPLALVGAFISMYIFHQTYNLMSIIGIIIMLGAIDNDAVIAVDMIISNRRRGMFLTDAIADGMQKRFRPIVMTALTSIIGMIPLLFGFGTGLELAAAISFPIIGGIIGSTIFTLFLIPVLYKYFDHISKVKES